MEVVLAILLSNTLASEDDSQKRLGKGSTLLCWGCWLIGDSGALGSHGEVPLQRLVWTVLKA